ncbi:S-layer homology domain-containing protein [Dermabacteraceae bacterium TAE3-ERU27]|nr:S-layer homology domain-containing protein [Dermabacteraceae bacterium TAE3-ERU27]
MRSFPRRALLASAALAAVPMTVYAGDSESVTHTVKKPSRRRSRRSLTDFRSVSGTFNLVALSWPGLRTPEVLRLRARYADGSASGWISPHPLPTDRGDTDTATNPVWTGDAVAVELEARLDGGDFTGELAVHLLDSRPLPGDGGVGSGGTAPFSPGPTAIRPGPGAPPVIGRAAWGADESRGRETSSAGYLRACFVHHSEGANDYTPAQSAQIVRAIHYFHTGARGWSDVGYNVLIDRYGQIFEGRKGGLLRPIVGSHALGFNTGSFGVCLLGSFVDEPAPAPALDAAADVIAWKLGGSFIWDVTDRVNWRVNVSGTPFKKRSIAEVPVLGAHRDVNYTDCCGDALYAQLDRLRDKVSTRLRKLSRAPYEAYGFKRGEYFLGTVNMLAHRAGDFTVSRLTRGLIFHEENDRASAWMSSFAADWQPEWGMPVEDSLSPSQAFENGDAVREAGSGKVTFLPVGEEDIHPVQHFSDVPPRHMFFAEIEQAYELGLITGWPDGTFRPSLPINRDAVAAMLYRMAGYPAFNPPEESPFVDVEPHYQFYKEMCWARAEGLINGWQVGEERFEMRRLAQSKRLEMAAFLTRAWGSAGYAPPLRPSFQDVPRSHLFYREIEFLAQTGISTGWPDRTFRPDLAVTRADMAVFLVRFLRGKKLI